jgi:transcriptional regulator with XRE-family HTH domain
VIIDSQRCSRLLGVELRRLRLEHGWTRDELVRLTGLDIAMQTLATYEIGTRVMPVPRLFDVADALGVLPQELVTTVHNHLFPERTGTLHVDLHALAHDPRPQLAPARRWAASRLRSAHRRAAGTVLVDSAALIQLARVCGLPPGQLRAALQNLTIQ